MLAKGSWQVSGKAQTWIQAVWYHNLCSLSTYYVWCWEGLGVGGEGDDRGWDGWMASLTLWMWVWVNSGSWWWTGRPGVLRFMGLQRVGHDWATELNRTEYYLPFKVVVKVKVKSLSRVWLLATPWTVAYQAPLSMGFSRQGTGVGCHFLLQYIYVCVYVYVYVYTSVQFSLSVMSDSL